MPARIDKVAGAGNRATFIREAVERMLADYEDNPGEYLLQHVDFEPDDKWRVLISNWQHDLANYYRQLEEVSHKVDALADMFFMNISPTGAGRNDFKKALAIEFKKHFAGRWKDKAAQFGEHDAAPPEVDE